MIRIRAFTLIVLSMLSISNSSAMELNPYLTLSYGAEKGVLCPTYADENGKQSKSIYIASAEAGLRYNLIGNMYTSVGYQYTGCVFAEGETLQSPYFELRLGSKKFLAGRVHYADKEKNLYSDTAYFYEFRLGAFVTDTLSIDVSAITGTPPEGHEQRIDYFLIGRIHF